MSGGRRSWLQAMAPRRVRWRAGRSREPPARSGRARSSRSRMSVGESRRSREAASSMANGKPSSWRQISMIAVAFPSLRAKFGSMAVARSTNRASAANLDSSSGERASAAWGTSRGGTGNSCSPWIRSGPRLVTRARTLGAPAMSVPTDGLASSTCSKLSSTSSVVRCRSSTWRASITGCGPRSPVPTVEAITLGTRCGSVMDASSTKNTPSGKRSMTSEAVRRASRVLPDPPGPVRVTTLADSSKAWTCSSSCSRPTNDVSSVGRLVGVSRLLSAGNSAGSPSTTNCWIR
jgi:hypothetical protein